MPERRITFIDHAEILPPEKEITPEQKKLLHSAAALAAYVTERWPQVDAHSTFTLDIGEETKVTLPEAPEGFVTEPVLNYYLSGSLALMLLSQAERYTELDPAQYPNIGDIRTREIPESARNILSTFARKIQDLDYVPSEEYKNSGSRNKLRKGAGGPSYAELPDDARHILQAGEDRPMVMCDPVQPYGSHQIAKITVGEQEYYIARPDYIFAYKILHIIQQYGKDPEKFNADFPVLFAALKEIYSEDELLTAAKCILDEYEKSKERLHKEWTKNDPHPVSYLKENTHMICRVQAHPQVRPEISAILEKLK